MSDNNERVKMTIHGSLPNVSIGRSEPSVKFVLLGADNRELIAFHRDGSVTGSVEDASEAGARFVEYLRANVPGLLAAQSPTTDHTLTDEDREAQGWREAEEAIDDPDPKKRAEAADDFMTGWRTADRLRRPEVRELESAPSEDVIEMIAPHAYMEHMVRRGVLPAPKWADLAAEDQDRYRAIARGEFVESKLPRYFAPKPPMTTNRFESL